MTPESPNNLFYIIGKKLFPNLLLHKQFESLPLTISWRRIFILPTKPGLFFGLVVLLMLIASLNFNNNMGLMMTFLLFGLAQVAVYRVFFNLKGLIINHVSAQPVFLGQEAEFAISLKSRLNRYDICTIFADKIGKHCVPELIADESQTLLYKVKPQKRGWLLLGKIKILTSFPFGLFFAWIWTNINAKCLVYPTPEKTPPPLPNHAHSQGATTIITQGEEFHGLKPFQAGDSMRLIAWKRTAQIGELVSRELQQTQGKKILFDYAKIPLADTEAKLSRLTAWVILAQQQQLDFCLQLPNSNSGFGCSSEHYLTCLKQLALFGLKA
ncbi:MAG: DUF58 domain-containing protein [Proteobacteria bacterium]|nr:DUF58 domain-containing protein [Pseudomonadota bacterium]